MNLWPDITIVALAYLLGSIPFGYIFTKYFTGTNILEKGSGNIGSTNVGRIAGKKVARITQVCDMLKGLLPVAVVMIIEERNLYHFDESLILLVALAAILGHDFSVFLKFKGGKGVNTTLGASLLIAPYSVFIAVMIYFGVKWKYKIVSLGSLCLAISLPVTEWIMRSLSSHFYFLLLSAGLIIIRHIPNIKRLLNGTENRVH